MRFSYFVASCGVLLYGIFATMPHDVAYAQALPAPSVSSFLSTVVVQKLQQIGFAANDPRVISTLEALSGEAESLAQAGASAAGSVPWSGVLGPLLAGVSLMATPTQLGDDTLVAWQVNHDGTITVTQPSGASDPGGASAPSGASGTSGGGSAPPLDESVQYYEFSYGNKPYDGATPDSLFAYYLHMLSANLSSPGAPFTFDQVSPCQRSSNNVTWSCFAHSPQASSPVMLTIYQVAAGTGSLQCPSGIAASGACVDPSQVGSGSTGSGSGGGATVWTGTGDPSSVAQKVPQSDLSRPLSPVVLADLADALWQNTSALPNYDGVPYPATNPITQSDVSTAQQASPSSYPNVGSLTTPLTLPVAPGSSNPFTLPAPSSSPSGDPASSPSTGSSPSGSNDLCAMHPEIVACQPLGSASAPTLPASSASVSLSPVSVGGPSNPVCPAPVGVDVFGSQLLIQYQPECDFMVRVRPFILAMCGIVAAGIFVAGLRS